ncbi:MAG: hypothetical protein ACE5SW_12760 [Nitrososphaeraceae archaeon]
MQRIEELQETEDSQESRFCIECNSELLSSWSELGTPFCEECFFNTGMD